MAFDAVPEASSADIDEALARPPVPDLGLKMHAVDDFDLRHLWQGALGSDSEDGWHLSFLARQLSQDTRKEGPVGGILKGDKGTRDFKLRPGSLRSKACLPRSRRLGPVMEAICLSSREPNRTWEKEEALILTHEKEKWSDQQRLYYHMGTHAISATDQRILGSDRWDLNLFHLQGSG